MTSPRQPPCFLCDAPSVFVLNMYAYCRSCAERTIYDVKSERAVEMFEGEVNALTQSLRGDPTW